MKNINFRYLYLYLIATVGLIVLVIGTISVVNLGIKTIFFKDVDSYMTFYPTYPNENGKLTEDELKKQKDEFEVTRKEEADRNRQRELSQSIAMIIVGAPLYFYHWKLIQKDNARG